VSWLVVFSCSFAVFPVAVCGSWFVRISVICGYQIDQLIRENRFPLPSELMYKLQHLYIRFLCPKIFCV